MVDRGALEFLVAETELRGSGAELRGIDAEPSELRGIDDEPSELRGIIGPAEFRPIPFIAESVNCGGAFPGLPSALLDAPINELRRIGAPPLEMGARGFPNNGASLFPPRCPTAAGGSPVASDA